MKRFYSLQDFFGGYFHPDWRLDDHDPGDVVERFIRTSSAQQRQFVTRDISELLSLGLDEVSLHRLVLRDYDLNYDPHTDELSMYEWLELVRDTIKGARPEPDS